MKLNFKSKQIINGNEFSKWVNDNWDDGDILPPGLEAQKGISFLIDYLLGEDWYVEYPASTTQINTEAVWSILAKYSKKFRKELKQHRKD